MGVRGFILLVLLPSALSAQEPYGSTVADIRIEGGPVEHLEVIPIAVGDTLTPEAVGRSIQALYDAGAYGRIQVEAVATPDSGSALVFHVEEPYFFSTVRMIPRTLFERSLSSYVTLPYGERFSRNRLNDIVTALEDQLRAEGYFEFRLSSGYALDPATRLATVTLSVEPGPRARVRRVRFEGGQQTLTEEELRKALGMNPGSEYRLELLRAGADRIRSEFAEVRYLNTQVEWEDPLGHYSAEDDAVDLVIGITPGNFALVRLIEEGDGVDLSDEELRALVPIYEEGRVDDDLIEEGRLNILDRLYREGFYQAEVETASVIQFPAEDGTIFFQINFASNPGSRFSVEEIRIEGNDYFTDEVLYAEIGISPGGLFRRGVVSPDLVEEAVSTIEDMYVAEGFFDTEVTTSELVDVAEGSIVVVLGIEEGRRLEIASVTHTGNTSIDSGELARVGNLYAGQIFTPGSVQAARSALTARYYAEGYPEARVRARVTRTPDDRLTIAYTIEEGPAYKVGRIFVAGNTLTKEKVILRNSEALREETPYNPQSILEAQRSLYATGLFNRVDIVPLAHERNGYRDVLIQIEDAGPLVLTYGVGVQDREGLRGTVEISHTNLWGLDRSISFRVRGSRREQRFQATYREPRLFNWELDGFASLFVERIRRDPFKADRIDFSIQTLKQFRATESFLVSASYQTVNIRDTFPDEEGVIQISRVGTSYIHDSRRREAALDPIDPNRGNYFTGSFQLASQTLGSEVNFTSFYGVASIYRPFNGAVLAAAARFGWNKPYGGTPLPITERYFAGGSTTLRAFRQDDVDGPGGRGGDALVLVNVEYRRPIPFLFSGFGGVLFYDTGTVFRPISAFNVGDFTHTGGVGLRYETPLGPIRADVGFNLNRQDGEPHHTFHFTLGHAF